MMLAYKEFIHMYDVLLICGFGIVFFSSLRYALIKMLILFGVNVCI